MNFEQGHTGYRTSETNDVEVSVHDNGNDEWVFSVESGGVHAIQGKLTKESVEMLRGDGPVSTCASVFDLIRSAASDYDNCEVFDQ